MIDRQYIGHTMPAFEVLVEKGRLRFFAKATGQTDPVYTDEAAARLGRVLWNDPGTGVMRHADAGYDIAVNCAKQQGLDLPMVTE